ncbi:alpha-2B adrenergic receptor-like [Mya arenaria]|uniref:alpha-2B adrenergic receptor-like n=1 Tax=Mya arenaria TaxID=6604 RepID=UPI0022E59AFB|nr:alpha-2B adrenergic receptor-like [Mya arenaria]
MENQTCYVLNDEKLLHDAGFLYMWLLAIPLVILCLTTIVANGVIILMFAIRRKIRRCRNTYIFSLAVANFLIGLTMPLSIAETLGEGWIFGRKFCLYFLTVRYSLFYVTILSIILISVDRWWSINFPFSYRIKRSKRITFTLVAIVWMISLMVHLPSILGWNYIYVMPESLHGYCRLPYQYNSGFVISASLIEFFIPLILLLSLNMGIYIKLAKRRNSKKIRRSLSSSDGRCRKTSSDSENNNDSEERADIVTALMTMRGTGRRTTLSNINTLRRFSDDIRKSNAVSSKHNSYYCHYSKKKTSTHSVDISSANTSTHRKQSLGKGVRYNNRKANRHDAVVRDFLLRQDNKALFSLALLVITFVVCWTPAIICDILFSLCPGNIPMWLLMLSSWILSSSAALNPFLYGIGSHDFRRVAKDWLCNKSVETRVLEQMMYSQLFQPCDIVAMKNTIVYENRRVSSCGIMSNV